MGFNKRRRNSLDGHDWRIKCDRGLDYLARDSVQELEFEALVREMGRLLELALIVTLAMLGAIDRRRSVHRFIQQDQI